jgi:cytochrome c oxidase subunit 4
MSPHIMPRSLYYRVFAALLGLTLATVGVAFLNLGPLNTIIALTIASGKALLVIFFFMHLRHSSALTWIFAGAGVLWLVHLLLFTSLDYVTRNWTTVTGW